MTRAEVMQDTINKRVAKAREDARHSEAHVEEQGRFLTMCGIDLEAFMADKKHDVVDLLELVFSVNNPLLLKYRRHLIEKIFEYREDCYLQQELEALNGAVAEAIKANSTK